MMLQKSYKISVRSARFFCGQTIPSFRVQESSPSNHTMSNCGQFYNICPDVHKTLFSNGGLPLSFTKQAKTFTETSVMIREPALEIIDLIKRSDLSKPVNRFVMYGEKGTGKSLTMAHLLHYALENDFLIIHAPWVPDWLRRVNRNKEMADSTTVEGNVDLPLESAAWLIHFKTQNRKVLKELDLKVTKEYIWSKREITAIGSPLVQLIDLGINRVKFASDVVMAIAEEIKILSSQKMCKTFVAVDGFNTFYHPLTRLRTASKKKVYAENVTLTQAFISLTTNDWSNGVVVLIVDKLAVPEDVQESHYPRYLLGKMGFEHLDPFIPIEVKNYSDKEAMSCMAYYRDRMWLRASEGAETELAFNSAKNPYKLMEICAPL